MDKRKREIVTRVIDGDTFLTKSRKHAVRLAHLDAPEKSTKRGARAAQELRKLIQGKKVEVHTISRDAFGRAIANVKVCGKSVNKAIKIKTKK